MLRIPYVSSPVPNDEANSLLLLANPDRQDDREPFRVILLGSPEGVRENIHRLHVLNYVEQRLWSQLIQIRDTGILIKPDQGDVLSYLVRWRSPN